MSEQAEQWEGWAIVELFGHRKLGGHVSTEVIGGGEFLRLDIPGPRSASSPHPIQDDEPEQWHATQFYGPKAVYCITPVEESVARRYAATMQPRPVARYELPPAEPDDSDGDDDDPYDGKDVPW